MIFNLITKYSVAGIFNAIIGYLVIFIFLYFNFNHYISSSIGYSAGLICSFFLSKSFVFKAEGKVNKYLLKFLTGFIISFGFQLLFLSFLISYILNPYVSQLLASIIYVVIFFIFSKYWIFNES